MAEYENPTFDEDKELDKLLADEDDEFDRTIRNQSVHIENIGDDVDTRTQLIVEQKQYVVKEYYKLIKEQYGLDPVYIDYSNFELGPDNKTLFLKVGDKEIQITAKKAGSFINLGYLQSKIGSGGANKIRDLLSLPTYRSTNKPLTAQAVARLQNVENNLPDVDNVEMTD